MIRGTTYDNTYANHYRDLSALKRLAGAHGIAILLIHHLRKKKADNVFNRISGTTAISGAVNASFTLVEEQRGSGRTRLSCIGRDIEYRELELCRNADNVWGVTAASYSPLSLCVNPCAVFTRKTLYQVQSTLFSWRYKTWETVAAVRKSREALILKASRLGSMWQKCFSEKCCGTMALEGKGRIYIRQSGRSAFMQS